MTALAAPAPSTGPSEARPKRTYFHGSLTELQDVVLLTGIYGEWHEQPNGVWRFRREDGAGLNWARTIKRIWFDGPAPQKERLKATIEAMERMSQRQSRSRLTTISPELGS